MSKQQGATLFMTLMAAFQVLLARYTKQDDIAVGTTTAGRDQVEVERLIGMLLNLLVIRTSLRRSVLRNTARVLPKLTPPDLS